MTESRTGRPSVYSAELADAICERLADGESLRAICTDPAMPARSTVFKWLSQDAAFADQYARAREAQADSLVDDMLEIVDDGTNDWMERKIRGENIVVLNEEALQRSKLRFEARKWMAGKLKPKKYGEKLTQELTGPGGGAVVIQATPHDEAL